MSGSHQIKEADKIKIIEGPHDKEGCSTVRIFIEDEEVNFVFNGDDSGFRCFEFSDFYIVCLSDITFEGTDFFINFISKNGEYLETFVPVHLNPHFSYRVGKFYNNFIEIIMEKGERNKSGKNFYKIKMELFEKPRALHFFRDNFYIFPFRMKSFSHSKFLPFQKTLYRTTVENYSE